jgi:hypothetical protein
LSMLSRSILTWAAASLLLLAAGCTMCAHPYDNCGPVFIEGDCTNCNPLARMNSIFMPGGVQTQGVPVETQQAAAAPAQAAQQGGGERVPVIVGPGNQQQPAQPLPPRPGRSNQPY